MTPGHYKLSVWLDFGMNGTDGPLSGGDAGCAVLNRGVTVYL